MTTRIEIGDNFHPKGRLEPVYASRRHREQAQSRGRSGYRQPPSLYPERFPRTLPRAVRRIDQDGIVLDILVQNRL